MGPNLPPSLPSQALLRRRRTLPIFPPPSQAKHCFGEGGHSQSSFLTPNLPPSLPSQALLRRRRTLPIFPPPSQAKHCFGEGGHSQSFPLPPKPSNALAKEDT